MRKLRSAARGALLLCSLALSVSQSIAQEAGTPRALAADPAAAGPQDLYLEVFVNMKSTGLIGKFRRLPDGSLATTEEELVEIGLKPRTPARTADGLVRLDDLPDVTADLDQATQQLFIIATNDARAPQVVDVGGSGKSDRLKPQSSLGAVLNYSLFASSSTLFKGETNLFEGVSGGFEARVFGPLGTLSQGLIAGYSDGKLNGLTRLATTWSYNDPERMMVYRAGDFTSGGLSWTRPVYLGGLQAQRRFSLRSDLVTLPLPSFQGTTAVPSTLEIYTQNTRSYAGEIGAGPFQVVNVPALSGGGEVRLVVRDSLGRETVTSLPFYTSNRLLAKGLLDFSVEAGYPRRSFGVESADYDDRLMGSGTFRYGVSDTLTIEGHVEGGADLINGGLGAAFPLGPYGVASLAGAGSHHEGRSGGLVNATIELGRGGWTFYGRVQRAFGDYQDIASVTAMPALSREHGLPVFSAGVPRAVEQATLSVPMPLDLSSLNLSYTHIRDAEGESSQIVGLSYRQRVFKRASVFATAFRDFDDRRRFGVFAGVSIPLGDTVSASTGLESGPDGTSLVADVVKSERLENGSYGWRVRASRGDVENRSGAVSYRAPFARMQAGIQQYAGDVRATAQVDGALAMAGGGIFAAHRIHDAFAVVDVGAPDVEVQLQNRPVGRTGRSGRILIPDLNSYEPNTISIDPSRLPVDANVPATKEVVVPADRSGVVVRFGVSEQAAAAVVKFVDGNGAPLPVGMEGTVNGSPETFIIGYDGEAYITGLEARNSVHVKLAGLASCRAQFAYTPRPGEQVTIGGVVCR